MLASLDIKRYNTDQMTLAIPSVLDVALITRPDLPSTVENFRKYLRGGGKWGYGPARSSTFATFSFNMSREAVVRGASSKGHPSGRSSNGEVAGLVWDLKQGLPDLMCHPIPQQFVKVRPDIEIRVDPVFGIVREGRPTIFYLQPRRTSAPDDFGMRALATLVISTAAVGDFRGADLLLYDLRCPAGEKQRVANSYTLADLPLLEDRELSGFLQNFADAYDILTKEGVEKRKSTRPKKDVGRQKDLF